MLITISCAHIIVEPIYVKYELISADINAIGSEIREGTTAIKITAKNGPTAATDYSIPKGPPQMSE